VATTGRGAFGILAQSVGGGGGFASVNGSTATVTQLGGISSSGNGGEVVVTTDANAVISTAGDGAHGIVAQSVGGGGGIAGDTAGPLNVTDRTGLPAYNGNGNGGPVSVNAFGILQLSGANAIGVFAQSIGGGGGFGSNFAGSTGTSGLTGTTASGSAGGTVAVSQSGSLSSLGAGGIGIFAQSQGPSGNGQVSIDIAGTVTAAASGTGVFVSAGQNNTLTLQSSARIDVDGGVAVRYVGDRSTASGSVLNVQNNGTIIGNILLNNIDSNAAGTVVNNSHNTLSAKRVEAHLVNNGTVIVGGKGTIDGTSVTGNFVQSQPGVLQLDANFGTGRIDRLAIDGNAELAGGVDVAAVSLLPGRMTFLDVGGSATGTLTGIRRHVFDFQVSREGNRFSVGADAAFNRPEFGLNASDSRVAGYFQQIWDNGGAGFGQAFAAMANADVSTYTNLLSTLRSGIANAPAAENLARTQQRLDRTMSCPVFQSGTTSLREGECVWAQTSGQRFNQGRFDGARGYGDTVFTYAMGGQKLIAPNWFLGFSAAYENSRISETTGTGLKIDGHSGSLGVALKHEMGPLLLSAAITGNYGTFDSSGMIRLSGVASGSQTVSGFGGRLRAAYTWDLGNFYVRPYLDADIVYTNAGSYSEIGSGLFNRQVAGRSEWALLASPTLEIGTRYDLADDYSLRAYARVGATFSSLDSWATTARLVGAPAGIDSFTITKPMDTVYGRVGAGLQLTSLNKRVSLQAEYNGDFSSSSTRHTGSLKLSVGF
jgi:hypothetical protein